MAGGGQRSGCRWAQPASPFPCPSLPILQWRIGPPGASGRNRLNPAACEADALADEEQVALLPWTLAGTVIRSLSPGASNPHTQPLQPPQAPPKWTRRPSRSSSSRPSAPGDAASTGKYGRADRVRRRWRVGALEKPGLAPRLSSLPRPTLHHTGARTPRTSARCAGRAGRVPPSQQPPRPPLPQPSPQPRSLLSRSRLRRSPQRRPRKPRRSCQRQWRRPPQTPRLLPRPLRQTTRLRSPCRCGCGQKGAGCAAAVLRRALQNGSRGTRRRRGCLAMHRKCLPSAPWLTLDLPPLKPYPCRRTAAAASAAGRRLACWASSAGERFSQLLAGAAGCKA